jgi:GFO/IDH/MocA oxidoreductase family protein
MQSVVLIGAGQLGSRHLQALKGVETPLDIHVVEPSGDAARVARERYDAVEAKAAHRVTFHEAVSAVPAITAIDVAVVATNADRRAEAVRMLLDRTRVRYLVLEKLLFARREDYAGIADRVAAAGARAWVNCSMRIMPTYERIRQELGGGPLHYRVTGSNYGLVTNAIHYLDHVVHLTRCESFALDTSGLDPRPIASKRPGFLELTGTLLARFTDGSRCDVTSFAAGAAPHLIEVTTPRARFIVREGEGRLWRSTEAQQWAWQESAAPIPRQSEMTTWLASDLLAKGECGLAPFAGSVKTHLQLLDPLQEFVRANAPQASTAYPFT